VAPGIPHSRLTRKVNHVPLGRIHFLAERAVVHTHESSGSRDRGVMIHELHAVADDRDAAG